jgi:hypothetical protein
MRTFVPKLVVMPSTPNISMKVPMTSVTRLAA